ncbi:MULTISPECIES: ABC transporter substrate-binding protein [Clostridium]|jgi:NitT/TauT family transport system substrate-binding protein|uniref:ABC transporter substrate-binding protein n=1 Tax=Clostridium TaxID=1485 RepID=UPI0023545B88|nr:ABC transporter substrate-binding protein [Clostridium thermopalmarium]MBE6044242.1 ABC transporter substrate-binding protein [Clostridium thermopalmarium]
MNKSIIKIISVLSISTVLLTACGSKQSSNKDTASQTNSEGLTKVTLGTYNGTCEAPLYAAVESGIFKKHGLDVELVNINAETLKEGLASGKIDGAQISPGMFKSIEQGLDIKLTNGVHTGCIQGVVPINSSIKSVADLKGKKIGVDAIGGVPMVLLSIELGKAGIDAKNDVEWRVYPQAQLQQALEKGDIDAFAAWDPYGALAVSQGKARKIFGNMNHDNHDNHHDENAQDNYCCYVGVSGKVAKNNPELAKAITEAWSEASAWVQEHPQDAAKLTVEKKYVSSGDEIENSKLIGEYEFKADAAKAKNDFKNTLEAMKKQGILDSNTDIEKLVEDTFISF